MTPRQQKLLRVVIDEFIETADAVGSVSLAQKYKLGVSPATIRNEMAALVDQGFLEKPHTSSGRVPTNMGFKRLINKLIDDLQELDTSISTEIYEDLFQNRFDHDELIYNAVKVLAEKSDNLAVVALGHRVYYAGLSNLIAQPEFRDVETLESIMSTIESRKELQSLFARYKGNKDIKILLGDDCQLPFMDHTALIFSDFKLHGDKLGYISIIGPNRMNYYDILPMFDFIVKSLNKVILGW